MTATFGGLIRDVLCQETPLILRREVPAAAFTRAVGLVVAGTQLTYACAPLLLGMLRDAQGDYRAAWWLCAGIDLAAAGIVLMRRRA